MNLKLTCLTAVLLLAPACGQKANQGAELESVAYQVGTLFIQPEAGSLIKGGVVQYRVYENGVVVYSGDVSYLGAGGSPVELQVPFSGKRRYDPATLKSASYMSATQSVKEKKVLFQVTSAIPGESLVKATIADLNKVDSKDAAGEIRVDTSADLIRIVSADITGTIFAGTPVSTLLHLKLAQTPPGA